MRLRERFKMCDSVLPPSVNRKLLREGVCLYDCLPLVCRSTSDHVFNVTEIYQKVAVFDKVFYSALNEWINFNVVNIYLLLSGSVLKINNVGQVYKRYLILFSDVLAYR